MAYACFDFLMQIIAQLPIIEYYDSLEVIGFRKIWKKNPDEIFTYKEFIQDEGSFDGLNINKRNFVLQCMNCFMICAISLQKDIFNSPGYRKYVT